MHVPHCLDASKLSLELKKWRGGRPGFYTHQHRYTHRYSGTWYRISGNSPPGSLRLKKYRFVDNIVSPLREGHRNSKLKAPSVLPRQTSQLKKSEKRLRIEVAKGIFVNDYRPLSRKRFGVKTHQDSANCVLGATASKSDQRFGTNSCPQNLIEFDETSLKTFYHKMPLLPPTTSLYCPPPPPPPAHHLRPSTDPNDAKRARLSGSLGDDETNETVTEDDRDTQRSPIHESLGHTTHARPLIQTKDESSESDCEVGPENLSLPKAYRGDSPPSGGGGPVGGHTPVAATTPTYHTPYQAAYAPSPYTPPPPPPPPTTAGQRSPVDVLHRVFTNRRRSDIEAALHRTKGDVLQALELIVCSETPTSMLMDEPRSAFSPLGLVGRSRRFLSNPFAGAGYLPPSVIRPPPAGADFLHHHTHAPIYPPPLTPEKPPTSSPGSASDRTSYSDSNGWIRSIFIENNRAEVSYSALR
ncbi:unnamed protein product [Nesidiocoris tenuis]|uniref:DMA domain-containing protein n=1 Tax=Nesidiocoris tenuis TaxID=355587 RepID=A0A6H5GFB1_9HEMI|nr:unnamed protein product [Nesidiocoris tenuis]